MATRRTSAIRRGCYNVPVCDLFPGVTLLPRAVGCIFGELVNNSPLFPGENDIEQLCCVLRVLGTPNEEIWPVSESTICGELQSFLLSFANSFSIFCCWIFFFWSVGDIATQEICNKLLLTHWGGDKMATFSQTTFSSAFSWMKR